ncbi:hypothetical protein PL9631_330007 [Planktothrix paucivesiculata PCC 9631]|uniref:Uncharacterized protein n=1 Tax=Planktothrix paucivesiculata PCC 9631 TaxID=671071 RepID=A0A7Z9BPD7_9CYAN|nr:hypothetical protein PL9631_330007 [Planktothrix paucivesiculata PCC 9631]
MLIEKIGVKNPYAWCNHNTTALNFTQSIVQIFQRLDSEYWSRA